MQGHGSELADSALRETAQETASVTYNIYESSGESCRGTAGAFHILPFPKPLVGTILGHKFGLAGMAL